MPQELTPRLPWLGRQELDLVQTVVASGHSLLLAGNPQSGKTSVLLELGLQLQQQYRTILVVATVDPIAQMVTDVGLEQELLLLGCSADGMLTLDAPWSERELKQFAQEQVRACAARLQTVTQQTELLTKRLECQDRVNELLQLGEEHTRDDQTFQDQQSELEQLQQQLQQGQERRQKLAAYRTRAEQIELFDVDTLPQSLLQQQTEEYEHVQQAKANFWQQVDELVALPEENKRVLASIPAICERVQKKYQAVQPQLDEAFSLLQQNQESRTLQIRLQQQHGDMRRQLKKNEEAVKRCQVTAQQHRRCSQSLTDILASGNLSQDVDHLRSTADFSQDLCAQLPVYALIPPFVWQKVDLKVEDTAESGLQRQVAELKQALGEAASLQKWLQEQPQAQVGKVAIDRETWPSLLSNDEVASYAQIKKLFRSLRMESSPLKKFWTSLPIFSKQDPGRDQQIAAVRMSYLEEMPALQTALTKKLETVEAKLASVGLERLRRINGELQQICREEVQLRQQQVEAANKRQEEIAAENNDWQQRLEEQELAIAVERKKQARLGTQVAALLAEEEDVPQLMLLAKIATQPEPSLEEYSDRLQGIFTMLQKMEQVKQEVETSLEQLLQAVQEQTATTLEELIRELERLDERQTEAKEALRSLRLRMTVRSQQLDAEHAWWDGLSPRLKPRTKPEEWLELCPGWNQQKQQLLQEQTLLQKLAKPPAEWDLFEIASVRAGKAGLLVVPAPLLDHPFVASLAPGSVVLVDDAKRVGPLPPAWRESDRRWIISHSTEEDPVSILDGLGVTAVFGRKRSKKLERQPSRPRQSLPPGEGFRLPVLYLRVPVLTERGPLGLISEAILTAAAINADDVLGFAAAQLGLAPEVLEPYEHQCQVHRMLDERRLTLLGKESLDRRQWLSGPWERELMYVFNPLTFSLQVPLPLNITARARSLQLCPGLPSEELELWMEGFSGREWTEKLTAILRERPEILAFGSWQCLGLGFEPVELQPSNRLLVDLMRKQQYSFEQLRGDFWDIDALELDADRT